MSTRRRHIARSKRREMAINDRTEASWSYMQNRSRPLTNVVNLPHGPDLLLGLSRRVGGRGAGGSRGDQLFRARQVKPAAMAPNGCVSPRLGRSPSWRTISRPICTLTYLALTAAGRNAIPGRTG